jgi:hypothetical protein
MGVSGLAAGAVASGVVTDAVAALVGSDERAAIRMAVPPMHTTMRPIAAVRLPVNRRRDVFDAVDFFEGMSPPQGSSGLAEIGKRGTRSDSQKV